MVVPANHGLINQRFFASCELAQGEVQALFSSETEKIAWVSTSHIDLFVHRLQLSPTRLMLASVILNFYIQSSDWTVPGKRGKFPDYLGNFLGDRVTSSHRHKTLDITDVIDQHKTAHTLQIVFP
jgi:hypothetical protein